MTLEDWLPTLDEWANTKFFGVDRDPHTRIGNIVIRPDKHVSDFRVRSWRERLFTRPWQPFKRTDPQNIIYILSDNKMICSWKTFGKIKEAMNEIT